MAAAVALAGCSVAVDPDGIATHVGDWRDQVIYQIVVDRFDNGDPGNDWFGDVGPVPGDLTRFQGGDWPGVRRRLDYLQRLGVTALWISPVVANVERTDGQDGYHGYWAADFTAINPRFGSLDDLRELVDDAHRRGMVVLVDVVTNHAGRVFYYDLDGDGALGEGELYPPYSGAAPYDAPIRWLTDPPRAWLGDEVVELGPEHFHRRGQFVSLDPIEREHGDFPTGLRDLDTEHPEVVDMMVDTYARWVELTDVDGFRLDAVPHVPHQFWATFARRLRERLAASGKHRFLLLGEVFHPDPVWLSYYTDGALDSVFDFSLKWELVDGFILDGLPAAAARGALDDYRSAYPSGPHRHGVELSPWQARVAFGDNHDMPRLRHWLDDPFAAELAMTAVFTVDAIPSIYYGTEQELSGGWGDAAREVMWETGFAEDTRMFRHLRRLSELRQGSAALRRGDLVVRYASEISGRSAGPGAGLLVWERAADDDRALVALNGHPIDAATAVVPTGLAPGTRLCDGLSNRELAVDGAGGVALEVPPRRAQVLLPCR